MFIKLLLLFTLVPLIELTLLIELGQEIGLLNTIVIVLVTGIMGAALARREGFGILARIQNELSRGELPGNTLIEGALVLSGALLLLTPGLITDGIGFLVLLPGTRALIRNYLKTYFRNKINTGEIHVNYKVEDADQLDD